MRNGRKMMCLLMVVLIIGMVPLSVLAETSEDTIGFDETIESNTDSELDVFIDADEVAKTDEISVSYRFGDYAVEDIAGGVLITAYHGPGGNINVSDATPGNGIINIGKNAFMYSNVLTGIDLRRTREIHDQAFIGCSRLEKVELGPELRAIHAYAFKDCISLRSLHIPQSVILFDEYVFQGCDNLTIYGVAGSRANEYANSYGIPFVADKPSQASVKCQYRTHVQNYGWQKIVADGATSGTSGQSLRLEAIQIGLETENSDLGIGYRTHVQNYGWEPNWNYDKDFSGTYGKGLRLEAIQIYLTGSDSVNYDVYYRVHAQNFGWLDWAKDGAFAGTAGFGYRLEAIQIKVVSVNSPPPGPTARPYYYKGGGVG